MAISANLKRVEKYYHGTTMVYKDNYEWQELKLGSKVTGTVTARVDQEAHKAYLVGAIVIKPEIKAGDPIIYGTSNMKLNLPKTTVWSHSSDSFGDAIKFYLSSENGNIISDTVFSQVNTTTFCLFLTERWDVEGNINLGALEIPIS